MEQRKGPETKLDIIGDGIRGMRREPGAVAAYVALIVVIALWLTRAQNVTPLSLIYQLNVPLVMAAVGMAIVLIAKGIDLSMGAMVVLAEFVVLSWTVNLPSPWLASLAALLVTTIVGLVNGFMVGFLKLPALVVTLATGSIASGVTLFVAPSSLHDTLPVSFMNVALTLVGPVPLVLILAFALPALVWFPVRRSRAGIALMAVGGDEAAAFVSGLKPNRVQMMAYVLSGVFAGFAGILMAMLNGGGSPATAPTYTLSAIAAAVLGGVALTGGRGSIAGAIAGAFILTFLTVLLQFFQSDPNWSYIFQGGILIIVVGVPFIVNQIRARRVVRS